MVVPTSGSQQAAPEVGGQVSQPGSVQAQVTPENASVGAATSNVGGNVVVTPQETPGVQYYTPEEYESLDPTAIDFKRVKQDDVPRLYRRQASVHGRVTQETREHIRRQDEAIRNLSGMVQSLGEQNSAALKQVADMLNYQKDKEVTTQTAAQKAREKEIYENLPDEAKYLFDSLMQVRNEVEQLKGGKSVPEDYEELRNFYKTEKQTREQQAVSQQADNIINGAITQLNLPNEISSSKAFGKRVRAYIREAWEAQEQRGDRITPLPEMTTWAVKWTLEEMNELGGLKGFGAAQTPGVPGGSVSVQQQAPGQMVGPTPEQLAAQGAPPRSTGSSGPAISETSQDSRRTAGMTMLFNKLTGRM